jgi:hypothetical protein
VGDEARVAVLQQVGQTWMLSSSPRRLSRVFLRLFPCILRLRCGGILCCGALSRPTLSSRIGQ